MALAGRPVSIGPSAYLVLNFELSGPSHLPRCLCLFCVRLTGQFGAYGNYTANMYPNGPERARTDMPISIRFTAFVGVRARTREARYTPLTAKTGVRSPLGSASDCSHLGRRAARTDGGRTNFGLISARWRRLRSPWVGPCRAARPNSPMRSAGHPRTRTDRLREPLSERTPKCPLSGVKRTLADRCSFGHAHPQARLQIPPPAARSRMTITMCSTASGTLGGYCSTRERSKETVAV